MAISRPPTLKLPPWNLTRCWNGFFATASDALNCGLLSHFLAAK